MTWGLDRFISMGVLADTLQPYAVASIRVDGGTKEGSCILRRPRLLITLRQRKAAMDIDYGFADWN